jgi:hypothetical protein
MKYFSNLCVQKTDNLKLIEADTMLKICRI